MKKILGYALGVAIFVAALFAYKWFKVNRMPNFGGEADVYVTATTTPEDVIAQITSQTSIKSVKSLRQAFTEHKVDKHITVGHYLVRSNYSSVYVARMLNNGWQAPVRITLSGALRTKGEISSRISRQLQLDSATVANALGDAQLLKKYGFTPQTVPAMIIPDTYEMYWTISIQDFLSKMKQAYDSFWTEDRLAKAKALKLSKMDVSILASIVNCESNYTPEYTKLAGVYVNRMRKHMRLQACPTVAYVYDFKLNRVLDKHLQVNSPYNTYRNDGLPPGPICCPSKAAIDAVLNAEVSEGWLFFCANSDFSGTHKFARTFAEHSRNGRAYQAALDQRKKANK